MYGDLPPVAERVAEYDAPCVAGESDVVVIARALATPQCHLLATDVPVATDTSTARTQIFLITFAPIAPRCCRFAADTAVAKC